MGENSVDIPKHIPEQKLNPPAIIEIVDINSIYPPKVQELLGRIKDGVVNIVGDKKETKEKINELNNELILKNLINLVLNRIPQIEKSIDKIDDIEINNANKIKLITMKKLLFSIESKKFKLIEIKNSNFLIFSLNGNNIDFILNKDGTIYHDFEYFNKIPGFGNIIEEYLKRKYGIITTFENGIYIYKDSKGNIINKFSNDFLKKIFEGLNLINDIENDLNNSFKK